MNEEDGQTLRIWQQNERKSNTAQQATLHAVHKNIDIICLQEPAINHFGCTVATPGWITVYLTKRKPDSKPRAVMLMNSRLSTNTWSQIDIDSEDITAIQITNEKGTIRVYNIYNDCEHQETIQTLDRHIRERGRRRGRRNEREERRTGEEGGKTADVWVGDFNRHHPMWERGENERLLQRRDLEFAEPLIDLIADHGMHMALPRDTPTIINSHGNKTRPDNVFVSEEIEEWVMECRVMEDYRPPKADHFPILTTIAFPTPKEDRPDRWDFRDVEWKEFRKKLEGEVEKIGEPRRIESEEEMEKALDELEKAIQNTMAECVPQKATTIFSKRWWTKELKQARVKARRAAGRARRKENNPDHPAHEEKRKARNEYANLLKKTKKEHWEEWLEEMDSGNMWKGHSFARAAAADGGRTRIPALNTRDENGTETEVKDNEEKSKLLHAAFFYKAPDNVDIGPEHEHPPEAFRHERITKEQVIRVAKKLKPHSAPGRSQISNSVLVNCIDIIADHLLPIYRATFDIKKYPKRWKRYTTIVLRKQGKADYKTASAYRPIALLDTMAKLLSACVKETLEYHTENLKLLPNKQFGGRPGCTTTDSLHMLVKFAKDAWRKNQDVAVVFMDVKGAFPNTVIPKLAHDMRRYGIPKEYTEWIERKTDGRETVISFDDYESAPIPIDNGLDQGCNLSTFLYRFYNADQIAGAEGKKDELATNFADDAMLATAGKDEEEARRKMEIAFHREGGPSQWAQSHYSTYEYQKFAYMIISRRRIPDPDNPGRKKKRGTTRIKLDGQWIRSTDAHKFLGVIIDEELRFKRHAAYAIEKGTKIANQIRRLSKNATGMKGELSRRMYYTSITTSMLYAADIWCPPPPKQNGRKTRGMEGIIGKLEAVQRRVAIQVTGALRTTPTDLLFAHADMLPMREQIRHICNGAALRIAALPKTHPLAKDTQQAAQRQPKRHPSPLHIILNMSKYTKNKANMEKIETTPRNPRWKPCIKPRIAKDREKGKEMDREDESDIKIYSDGSGHDGGIGAAAVLYQGFRRPTTARKHLGKEDEHTVFEAECTGQLLALQLLKKRAKETKLGTKRLTATIAVDNQASLTCHTRREHQPGATIIEAVQKTYGDLTARHPNLKIRFRWVPGHENIEGSEKADSEAKKAAEGKHKDTSGMEGILKKDLPMSKAAARQELRKRNKAKYIKSFQQSWRYEKIARIDHSMPSTQYRRICKEIPRNKASILVKLRMGHVPLNAYLHRFHLAESPICQQCNREPETVTHYLKYCTAYKEHRKQLQKSIGPGRDTGPEILGDKENIKALFRYIHRTGRFKDSHGDMEKQQQPNDEQNEERDMWDDRNRWG